MRMKNKKINRIGKFFKGAKREQIFFQVWENFQNLLAKKAHYKYFIYNLLHFSWISLINPL